MRFLRLQIILLIIFALSGCSMMDRFTQKEIKYDPNQTKLVGYEEVVNQKTIYVVSHGWHTGIVLKTSDVSSDIFPEIDDFDDVDYVELGWGDEGFYRAKKITASLVFQAAFLPTPSVLHVAGFNGRIQQFYQMSDIIEVKIEEEQFDNMCQFINETFAHDEQGDALHLGPGIYGKSSFYRANGKYYAPKTCNVWTAKALKKGGFPIIPAFAATAGNVLSQTSKFGKVIQKSPSGLKAAALRGSE